MTEDEMRAMYAHAEGSAQVGPLPRKTSGCASFF